MGNAGNEGYRQDIAGKYTQEDVDNGVDVTYEQSFLKLFTIIISLLFLSVISLSQNSIAEKPPYIFQDEVKTNDDEDWTNKQGGPSIAIYENIVYITWPDYRNDSGIYFTKSIDGGKNFSENIKISNGEENKSDFQSDITVNGKGYIFVGWVSDIDGDTDIYFSKSTDGGESFKAYVKINDDAFVADQSSPKIAVQDDYIYVVWQDYRNHPPFDERANPDIYFARSTDGGKSFEPNIRVNDDLLTAYQAEPNIAISKNGEVYIVWMDDRNDYNGSQYGIDWDIYLAKSNDQGISFEKNVRVSKDVTYKPQSDPSIAIDGSGNVYVAWCDQREGLGDESGNCKIYSSKSTNGGLSFGPDEFLMGGPSGVSITADQNDVYFAIFSGSIYFIYMENGEIIYDPITIVSQTQQGRAVIAVDNQANVYIVWNDLRSGYGDIYFKKGIRSEPSNGNGDDAQNNHQNQEDIDNWFWVLVAVVLIACVAYIVQRKRSGKHG